MTKIATAVAKTATTDTSLRRRPLPRLTEADLKDLRIFKEIADNHGLTQAARVLGVEKSALSRALARLEARLGEILCIRGPKGFEVSDFGKAVLSSTVMLNDALELARTEILRARHTLTGSVRLAVPDNCLSNPAFYLPDVLKTFAAQMPEVELHLQVMTVGHIEAALLERRVDLAIADNGITDQALVCEEIFCERTGLYMCSPAGDLPPPLHELYRRGAALVMRSDERLNRTIPQSLRPLCHRRIYASGLEGVAMLLQAGNSAGFLPMHFASLLPRHIRCLEVPGAEPLRYDARFTLIWEPARPRTWPVQSLISLILAHPQRQRG